MKSPLEAPEKQIAAETSAKREKPPAAVIDTSKMAKGQREALELAEAARDPLEDRGSFASNLFIGRYDFDRIYPYPAQTAEDRAAGEDFLRKLETYLREHVDPDEIDRTGEIPPENFKGLAEIGAFGIKVPKKYGGLGLSQSNYGRAAVLLGSWDGNVAALVSAHQSIGVAQPLMLFGTEEQKQKYLPRVARGEISAFALTETHAGSDPATMSLKAEPTPDGSEFVLNGEKLWCTNGVKAGVLVVMARTPPKIVNGRERKQISAFIVDAAKPATCASKPRCAKCGQPKRPGGSPMTPCRCAAVAVTKRPNHSPAAASQRFQSNVFCAIAGSIPSSKVRARSCACSSRAKRSI